MKYGTIVEFDTLKMGSTTYTINPKNKQKYLGLYAKTLKSRRKSLTSGCGRKYPRFGPELSTHEYVHDYFALNSYGVYTHLKDGLTAGLEALKLFQPLSQHITKSQGEDTFEMEN